MDEGDGFVLPGEPPGLIDDLRGLLQAKGITPTNYDLRPLRVAALGSWAVGEHPVMLVSMHAPIPEVCFAVAHELGHAALAGRGLEKDPDAFAAEFLMPGSDIRPSLRDMTFPHLLELAEAWRVPPMAIARRARDTRSITGVRFRELRAKLRHHDLTPVL